MGFKSSCQLQNLVSVSSQNFALHFAIELHLALALLLAIGVMIRSSCEVLKLVHHSLVSLSFAHPSRCSRSTLTTVCFCVRVSVFTSSLQPRHQIHHRLVTVILKWSVGSMVSRIPILQTCKVVMVLKQRLASFQHLRSSSP